MNAKTLEDEMEEWEEVALEIEVIAIEMIEDLDKIEDLMAVIAIEEETLTEDPDHMIGIIETTGSKIADNPWAMAVVTDLDLVQETTVWKSTTHTVMTTEEITEVPVTSMETDNALSVVIEVVTEDNTRDMKIETSEEDRQEVACHTTKEESLISEEDMMTEATGEETAETLVEEVAAASMRRDLGSSETVFASTASKRATSLLNVQMLQTEVVVAEAEVTEVASDTAVAEETSAIEAHQWEKEVHQWETEVHQWETEAHQWDMTTGTKSAEVIGKTDQIFSLSLLKKQKNWNFL